MATNDRVTDPELIKKLNALANPEASGTAELNLGIPSTMSNEDMQQRLSELNQPVTDSATLSILNEEVPTQEAWYEDPLNASRMVLDGMWFGWSEEIGAGVAAGLVKMIGGYGSERDYKEIYREMVEQVRTERDAYEKKHETASTVLSLAGSIASPANVLGGSAIAGARTGTRLATGVAVGATEGAVAGAGAAQTGETLEGAKSGATLGALIPVALTGGRKLIDSVSSRKLAQELGEGKEFIPLPLAAVGEEGKYADIVSSFYKDIVGKSFGGSNLIAQQSKRFSQGLQTEIKDTKKQLSDLLSKSKNLVREAGSANKADLNLTKASIKTLEKSQKGLTDEVKIKLQREKELINVAKTQELDAFTNATEEAFRKRAINESIPVGADKKTIDNILSTKDMQEVNRLLDEQWAEKGFSMLKNRKFRVNQESITAKLDEILGDDIALANLFGGNASVNSSADFIKGFIEQYTTKGNWIDGAKLSSLRSAIGRYASKSGDADVIKTTLLREFQDILNNDITNQLGKTAKKAFEEEREKWGTLTVLRDATVKASTAPGKRGQFTASDWLVAAKSKKQNLIRKGAVRLQNEADETAELVSKRDNHLIDLADQQLKKKQSLAEAEINGIEKRTIQSIKNLENRSKSLTKTATDSAEYKAIQNQIAEKNTALEALREKKEVFSEMLPKGRQSIFEKLAATSALALNPFGMSSLPVGLVVGRVLASPSAQRAFAGQANWQKGMQNITEMLTKAPTQVAYGASRVDVPIRAGVRTIEMQQAEEIGVSPQELKAMSNSSGDAKARAYYKFYQTGKLEDIKKRNKKVYDELRQSYEKATGNVLE